MLHNWQDVLKFLSLQHLKNFKGLSIHEFSLLCCNHLQVKAFMLEPGTRAQEPSKEGIIDADGEVLARGKGSYNCDRKPLMSYDTLQITVHQGLATLFFPLR